MLAFGKTKLHSEQNRKVPRTDMSVRINAKFVIAEIFGVTEFKFDVRFCNDKIMDRQQRKKFLKLVFRSKLMRMFRNSIYLRPSKGFRGR